MNFNAPNNIYQNWNKDLYIATKKETIEDDYHNIKIIYNEPYYFGKVNYQPLTAKQLEAYMKTYGETENNIVSCLINSIDKDKFNIFDVAYLYGVTPEGEKVNGSKANYIVRAFKPQNTKIMVLFEEIIKEDNNGES